MVAVRGGSPSGISSYCWLDNFNHILAPNYFAWHALHEAGHSMFGLDNESTFSGIWPCDNSNCSKDQSCFSNNCANTPFLSNCVCGCFEGCSIPDSCRCKSTCRMNLSSRIDYCPRCMELVTQQMNTRCW